MTRHGRIALLLLATLLITSVALAGSKDLAICLPGFPGTTAQAQPYIDKMLRDLERKLGYGAGSMTGIYLPDGAAGVARLEAERPGLALVGPSIYAARGKSLKMKVVAKVAVEGRGEETYSVVVKKGGPASLALLKGKRVTGAVLHDAKYVANVLLDRALTASDLTLVPEARPLQALRNVARDKADAAIVDQAVVAAMKDLDFAGELTVLATSRPVPAAVFVVMGEAVDDAAKIGKVLTGLCAMAEGQELCRSLRISGISPATNADLAGLEKRYSR